MTFRNCFTRGFTLVEMITVIVIMGIIGVAVAVFLRAPVQGYFDLQNRAELTDTADTALRRMGRDLRLALPNSIRVPNASCLQFIPTVSGGRYRADGAGNLMRFDGQATVTFDVLGAMPVAAAANDWVAVYNLGIAGADAYAGNNRAQIANVAAGSITLTGAGFAFPLASPSQRFQVIPAAEAVVTYACSNGNLYRFPSNNFGQACPNSAALAGQPILAQNVSACTFGYDQLINDRNSLVAMQIYLTRNDETVSLYHEVHVSNVP